ncbi:hypothetical protein [Peribacillus glennii]|uniref:Uncharacterized protein n=1 Tax=Peribacillus glennii TaxID=2303991 RepID=A0A372L697_9BACI|nr:hypothetical protein [Peribacillus glennii]RFU60528.1 hypothetical protein D0466_21120 [Peribacillus glennii]
MNDEFLTFFCSAYADIVYTTNFHQYENMSAESQQKWKKKMAILVCKEYEPRKNFDFPMADIVEFVSVVIESIRERLVDSEDELT